MPNCKHCGSYESSNWNLAGFTCSDCRLSCPYCGKTDKLAYWHRFVIVNGHAFTWCHGCGNVLPPELNDLDSPVESADVQAVLDSYAFDLEGVTWRDSDDVDGDADTVSDVPLYFERELPDGVTAGGAADV